MAYDDKTARALVIDAGKRLVEAGLIARTWGNISARISDTEFIITPSGMAYETLTPDKLVTVQIADCKWEGDIKPSSEKGVHAEAYKYKPEVNFVIHTHQLVATAVGTSGESIRGISSEFSSILGSIVPCAEYGISSTKKLMKKVSRTIQDYTDAKAILMRYHGTLCMGTDYENAFKISETLEKLCIHQLNLKLGNVNGTSYLELLQEQYLRQHNISLSLLSVNSDFGSSKRDGDKFILELNGDTTVYSINEIDASFPIAVQIHKNIYMTQPVSYIHYENAPSVQTISSSVATLHPMIDDMAQIAGTCIHCISAEAALDSSYISKMIKGKSALLIQNQGALCIGNSIDDAAAVGMVLTKNCVAELTSALYHRQNHLKYFDALLQRTVYIKKYSKLKN